MKNKKLNNLTIVGVLSAIAFILYFLEFPILPAFPWLMVDFSEIPVLLGTFALGPLAGILIELIKNILHFAFKNATGGVGELANFILGVSFLIPAGIIYKKGKSIGAAIIGMIVGIIFACIASAILNLYLFIPLYFPTLENVWGYIFAGAIPVTVIRFLMNGLIVFLLYPKVRFLFKK